MGPAQGPDTGAEQGFVDVDVAQTGHFGLVQEQRLHRPMTAFQERIEPVRRKVRTDGIRSQAVVPLTPVGPSDGTSHRQPKVRMSR